MIIVENLIILAVFGVAIGFIIKKISGPFLKKNTNAGSCSSCTGSCSSIPKFEDLPEIRKVKR
jgi:hypothetical protein